MVNGSPSAILDGYGNSIATINSFENVEGDISIVGCSDADDIMANDSSRRAAFVQGVANIADSRRKLGEGSAEVEKARNYLNQLWIDQMHPDDKDQNARHLGMDNWATSSNWCGAGSTLLGLIPCPKAGNTGNFAGAYDLVADRACRRHDHSTYAVSLGYAVRLGCHNDYGLFKGTLNVAVQAVYNPLGLAKVWGCVDKGKYKCWYQKKFLYGTYRTWGYGCFGQFTKTGILRYNGFIHQYGYWVPPVTCAGDLPMLPSHKAPKGMAKLGT